MVRVGLTGGLGSGKSAVALVFAEGGAHVFSADELGRALMQPGQAAFEQIVEQFGEGVVAPDGRLDRRALAEQAFERGRLEELNAIVHPAVFAAQEEQMRAVAVEDPDGIAVIESALIFEVGREGGRGTGVSAAAAAWRNRFDRLVLVTAPDEIKIARYVARCRDGAGGQSPADLARLERDARARLAAQMPDAEKAPFCDFVIENTSTLVLLRRKAQAVLAALRMK